MFATAARMMSAARKGKPKMKPIEPRTPPEQTQTITRAIFDVIKEHGPLTIADAWAHLKVFPSPPFFFFPFVVDGPVLAHLRDLDEAQSLNNGSPDHLLGIWVERFDKQKTYEDIVEMDEGKAKTSANL
ncbi:uncharacterized protein A4U43_C01F32320 [Asparagus officinalis]|uniref:Uncharacterized protein n=1 Tax=Asparagus officinalis TaxID=4686 RepID=A0A5P1FUH0_ASPOF|nr:uncharacterized protein A4U43_C01F32320 [Asparagus officinalis]